MMKKFSLFFLLLSIFFIGCDNKKIDEHHCATCNMPIEKSSPFRAELIDKNINFDDVGCAILYIDKHKLNNYKLVVTTKDTNEQIVAEDAFYSFDELTPMNYGFAAYKNNDGDKIDFKEVYQRMLRGENMSNPKIKKQLLGNKK